MVSMLNVIEEKINDEIENLEVFFFYFFLKWVPLLKLEMSVKWR